MATIPEALVVDASVALKWHLKDEADAKSALLLLDRFVSGQVALFAPSHIRYEVSAVITHATIGRAPRLTQQVARESIAAFLSLGIQTVETNDLILAALPLAHQRGIAFYDSLYLALSNQLDLPLITADGKLYDRIRSLRQVIWLGAYH
jgi:predicted nucleic acid-binding protein